MMVSMTFYLYYFILGLPILPKDSSAQRRIVGGAPVNHNYSAGYVVYLRESRSYDTRIYKAPWICGGAIITPSHILTSAACVKNVDFLLAIAGTRKFESMQGLKKCMNQQFVKRVISICVPKKYNFNYSVEHWVGNDIAVVEVETPYSFSYYKPDNCYEYSPRPIQVNNDPLNEASGTDAIVFGWGHKLKYGTKIEVGNVIAETLHYAPVLVINKELCKEYYSSSPITLQVIDNEKICTYGAGNLNYEGLMYDKEPDEISSTTPVSKKFRRSNLNVKDLAQTTNGTVYNTTDYKRRRSPPSKDNIDFKNMDIGICQNDHGGPLVRWRNRREVLIGLASVFLIGSDERCVGPFLYTSTASHWKFIECVTDSTGDLSVSRCDDVDEMGYEIHRREISWDNIPTVE